MKKSLLYILIIFIFSSCSKKDPLKVSIDNEVKQIKSIANKKTFLSNLYDNSQGIIDSINELEKRFLANKTKIYELRKKRDSLIPINSYKTEAYLKKFDYPSTKDFNEKEKMAIYYTIFNEVREKEQVKYLNLFKQLYKDSAITKYNYLGYLSKIYYLKNASLYKFDKRHSIEEMIDDISLEVNKIKEEIE